MKYTFCVCTINIIESLSLPYVFVWAVSFTHTHTHTLSLSLIPSQTLSHSYTNTHTHAYRHTDVADQLAHASKNDSQSLESLLRKAARQTGGGARGRLERCKSLGQDEIVFSKYVMRQSYTEGCKPVCAQCTVTRFAKSTRGLRYMCLIIFLPKWCYRYFLVA